MQHSSPTHHQASIINGTRVFFSSASECTVRGDWGQRERRWNRYSNKLHSPRNALTCSTLALSPFKACWLPFMASQTRTSETFWRMIHYSRWLVVIGVLSPANPYFYLCIFYTWIKFLYSMLVLLCYQPDCYVWELLKDHTLLKVPGLLVYVSRFYIEWLVSYWCFTLHTSFYKGFRSYETLLIALYSLPDKHFWHLTKKVNLKDLSAWTVFKCHRKEMEDTDQTCYFTLKLLVKLTLSPTNRILTLCLPVLVLAW